MSCLLLLLLPVPAIAADARLTITDPGGRPLADAVVSAYPAGAPKAVLRAAGPYRVAQQDVQFKPGVLIVPVGASVAFPNLDRVRHHVYSFSPVKRFELKLYGRDESHSIVFDKPGTVALGCNIHDGMSGFVRVVDTPFAGKSAANGAVLLTGLAPGTVRLRLWHPRLKGRGNELEIQVAVPPGGLTQTLAIPVRAE
ncbi:MAG TPA: methylamine utilization protein [Sphingomonas sp.]|jgi:plastocyanin|uniref:methylamine utilization protein n=1 Tax=Sphingomonas sp. TaxID=28214 RepID=UPI002ED9032E